MAMVISTRKHGSYKIQCTSAEDYVTLEQFLLELPLQDKLYKIPLEKPYRRRDRGENDKRFDNLTVRVTVVGSCEDDMA